MTPQGAFREQWRWFRLRGFVLVLVFACGFFALSAGAVPSDRISLANAGVLERAYYTLTLFVLGGTDLGVPAFGPAWARALLWVAYFAAPAVTASALVEAIATAVGPGWFRLRRMNNHVVLGGAGRLSMLYLARLRRQDPRCPVVIVESRPERAATQTAKAIFGAEVVFGDISDFGLLSTLRLGRARRVMLLTGNDFANLEAASKIIELHPDLAPRTVVHIGDLQLLDALEQTRVRVLCATFNSYRVAAQNLVRHTIAEHFAGTEGSDCIVLVGFGRFGQTVLSELQACAGNDFDTAVIVDIQATRHALLFQEKVGFSDSYRRHVLDGDIHDPTVWAKIVPLIQARHPLIVVGCGDDPVNLRAALELRRRCPKARLVVRSFALSAFARELAEEKDWDCFGVAELLERSMPNEWFKS